MGQHFLHALAGSDNNPVGISHDQIAAADTDISEHDGLDPVLARPHEPVLRIQWVARLVRLRRVTTDTMHHGCRPGACVPPDC